jgi:hypothetical protein
MSLFVSIDVGQLADPTALAVPERCDNRIRALRLERLPLHQPNRQQATPLFLHQQPPLLGHRE